jgi:hypothetical protein
MLMVLIPLNISMVSNSGASCQEKSYQFGERKKLRDQETGTDPAAVALSCVILWLV